MHDKTFIFLAGLHRSGTTLIHKIMRDHPDVSGFSNTGVHADEGMFLQTVYKTAKPYGGPGKFAFNSEAYMNELHPLSNEKNAIKVFQEWSQYYDLKSQFLLEKSPPNLIRTRFLQSLFPESKFVVILRHPLAVAYATQKWQKRTSIISLIRHSILAYEIFYNDMPNLNSKHVIRYEDFIQEPQKTIDNIFAYIGLPSVEINYDIQTKINEKYFELWEEERNKLIENIYGLNKFASRMEERANVFGYSLINYMELPKRPCWFNG